MSSVIKTLEKATDVKASKGEDRQEYLARLIKAVSKLSDEAYEELSEEAQDWNNAAVIATKAKEEIPDPEESTAPKAKAKKVTADEDEDEADDEDEDEDEAPAKSKKAKAKKVTADEDEDEADDEDEDEDEAPAKSKKAKAPKAKAGISTLGAALKAVVRMKKSASFEQLGASAVQIYQAAGGTANPEQVSVHDLRRAIKAAVAYGIATFENKKLTRV
jgi:cobalamin biosynthesis protein CobT